MAKYIYLYKGPATNISDMAEPQSKAFIDGWKQWIEKLGHSLVDIGQPIANGISVVDDGSEGTAAEMNGFSIVEAENFAEARSLADGHPYLSEGKGNFAIDIFELVAVPM